VANTEDELTDYQLTDDQIRKVLHEPVAPYVVNVYNTLMHLVEGLVTCRHIPCYNYSAPYYSYYNK